VGPVPVVNPLARELVFKIVYYGPGLGGKTTTLQHIHATSKPEHRGKMVSLATPVDRTLYFDFLPIRVPNVRGMGVRLQLFTVPGQVYYNATRKLVLTGADGVVMVLDSQRVRNDANLESFDNLRENLREHGRALAELPHVIQYNKRDIKDVVSIEELDQQYNPHGAPTFGTVATIGTGVYEALEGITRAVLADFERRLPDQGGSGEPQLQLPEEGLAAALRQGEPGSEAPHPEPEPMPRMRPVVEVGTRVNSAPPPPLPPPKSAPPPRRSSSPPPPRRSSSPAPAPDHVPDPFPPTPEPEPPEELDAQDLEVVPGDDSDESPPPASDHANTPIMLTRPSHPAPALPPALSFAELWPEAERPVVRELEEALSVGDYEHAVARSEQLVARSFAAAAGLLGATGDAPRDPAVVALLLGLDGRRYLEFRAVVRESRVGRGLRLEGALNAYAFALEARLARLRAGA
jgi:mutual gliding-motility protein MglA